MAVLNLKLFKKEFRQNVILYLLPAPFVLGWLYLRFLLNSSIPSWVVTIFGLALPFTLAIAYGLQAFDVEEDSQTRDFLLVKPISIQRIVAEKFLIGLGLLLLWTILLIWGAGKSLVPPSIANIDSWVPSFVILGVCITYSASFTSGLLITGPKKLIVSTILSIVGLAWGFVVFSSLTTFALINPIIAASFLQQPIFYLASLIVLVTFIGVQFHLSVWQLLQRPRIKEIPSLSTFFALSVFVCLFSLGLNLFSTTPIRSTYFAGLEIFGLDRPFWAIDGVWQPNRDVVALTGTDNMIGLLKLGKKPVIIYRSAKTPVQSVKDVTWSPDGKDLAFVDRGQVFIMNMNSGKLEWIGKGVSPSWSADSKAILFAQENAPAQSVATSFGKMTVHTFDFYRADLESKKVQFHSTVQALNSSWTWDSLRDNIVFLDPYGRLTVYGKSRTEFVPLPSITSNKEGVFWSRFYPVGSRHTLYLLSAFSLRPPYNQGIRDFFVHFYLYDSATNRVKYLSSTNKHSVTGLIFDPTDGTCLWGSGSAYSEEILPLTQGESK